MNNCWENRHMEALDMVESIPFVSVVMMNWNRKDIFEDVLKSVCRADIRGTRSPSQTMASTDGAAEMVETESGK